MVVVVVVVVVVFVTNVMVDDPKLITVTILPHTLPSVSDKYQPVLQLCGGGRC